MYLVNIGSELRHVIYTTNTYIHTHTHTLSYFIHTKDQKYYLGTYLNLIYPPSSFFLLYLLHYSRYTHTQELSIYETETDTYSFLAEKGKKKQSREFQICYVPSFHVRNYLLSSSPSALHVH